MINQDLAIIKEAVSKGQDETIVALIELAREWAHMVEGHDLPYNGPDALRLFANTVEKQWAKSAAGVAHAAE